MTDWVQLKASGYTVWRQELWDRTIASLKSAVYLSDLNQEGYFHHVPDSRLYLQMKREWEELRRVPPHWISKGSWPGIWLAMFDPNNTFSRSYPPHMFLGFYFKEGYRIYDAENSDHVRLWEEYGGKESSNPWDYQKNEAGKSLRSRLEFLQMPGNKNFFLQEKFGAIIGYSDYVAPVILLEDSVQSVEFLS